VKAASRGSGVMRWHRVVMRDSSASAACVRSLIRRASSSATASGSWRYALFNPIADAVQRPAQIDYWRKCTTET
jgi:hypothetical protein